MPADLPPTSKAWMSSRPSWCVDRGATLEAMTTCDLWLALARGELSPETKVWREGMPWWDPVSKVPEFALAMPDASVWGPEPRAAAPREHESGAARAAAQAVAARLADVVEQAEAARAPAARAAARRTDGGPQAEAPRAPAAQAAAARRTDGGPQAEAPRATAPQAAERSRASSVPGLPPVVEQPPPVSEPMRPSERMPATEPMRFEETSSPPAVGVTSMAPVDLVTPAPMVVDEAPEETEEPPPSRVRRRAFPKIDRASVLSVAIGAGLAVLALVIATTGEAGGPPARAAGASGAPERGVAWTPAPAAAPPSVQATATASASARAPEAARPRTREGDRGQRRARTGTADPRGAHE